MCNGWGDYPLYNISLQPSSQKDTFWWEKWLEKFLLRIWEFNVWISKEKQTPWSNSFWNDLIQVSNLEIRQKVTVESCHDGFCINHRGDFFFFLMFLPVSSRYWLQTSRVPGARLQRGTQVHHLSEWQIHHRGLQHQAAVLRQGIPKSRVTISFIQLTN